jgi:hypothetical protein
LRSITSSNLVGCTGRSAGIFTFQDAVDIQRRSPVLVQIFNPIGRQAAARGKRPQWIDRRQAVPGRERHDQLAMHTGDGSWLNDQTAVGLRANASILPSMLACDPHCWRPTGFRIEDCGHSSNRDSAGSAEAPARGTALPECLRFP